MTSAEKVRPPEGPYDLSTGELVAVPTIYSNRFYFTGLGPNVRLTFAEQALPTEKPVVRSAILLSVADALQLKDLLVQMLADVQVIDMAAASTNG